MVERKKESRKTSRKESRKASMKESNKQARKEVITCPDTFASSYRGQATREAGGVAAMAEERKSKKYAHLAPHYFIQPVAIETSGAFGPSTLSFLKELGKRISLASGEPRSTQFLLQRLSMAVQ